MVTYNIQPKNQEGGFALIMALVISSVVLSIGLSMLSITVKLVDLTTTARESEVAFQAAAAALDCAIFTRFTNEDVLITTSPASSLSFSCGPSGVDGAINLSGTGSLNYQGNSGWRYYSAEGDWDNPSGFENFVVLEIFVISEDASNRNFSYPDRDFTASTCPSGTYCTYIFAQGHNRSEAELASGASFAVQRELTAEF